MKVFWLDTETTGLNSWKCDIIQLAGLIEIDGVVVEKLNYRIKPIDFNAIQPKALECNGITLEQLRTFPTATEVYQQFIKVISKYVDKYDKNDKFIIAGQNTNFDIGFVRDFFKKQGDNFFGSYFSYQSLDLLALTIALRYKGILKTENLKLETMAKHFGIEYDAHDALADIETTRTILNKILAEYIVEGTNNG